ncbi:MAG TPA: aldehyde dehydrogenase family protein [Steroidobacteraceae bacterium]|nr:aldehyde dehydrogenase family protein [Steroidobacteraceae bacterium]
MIDFNAPYGLLIDGQLVQTSAKLEVVNPATGKVFATCPAAGAAELDMAVAAARRAFPAWRALSFEERAGHVARIAAALEAHKEPLARLLTQEQGKPVGQSRDEIARAGTLSVGMTKIRIAPETILDNAQRLIELHWRPLGVAGIITPWNAPVNLAAGPLASALYAGNCAIIKPSPFTPLTTLRIGELLRGILPAGVVSVLSGGDELGALMTAHPGIDKISFTGSVATGKKVMAGAAGTLKRVTLELGGNDAAIVLPDVDVADVAKKLFFAATVNSGQVCMAVKRIYAHEDIYEALCAALAAEARQAKLGDGLDPATTLGPIQNRRQYERVCELKDDARQHGRMDEGTLPAGGGYFVAPTVVTGLGERDRLVAEEQFGPVFPVLPFSDVNDAVARANDTRFGLAGSVWSRDTARATAIAARLEVGTAWVNQHRITAADVPFGGAKESGIGRTYSRMGLEAYMEPQVISVLRS